MRTLTNKEITNSHNFNFTFFVYLGRSWGGHWPGNIDITKYRFYMQLESTLLYRNIETSCNRSNRRTRRPSLRLGRTPINLLARGGLQYSFRYNMVSP